MNEKVENCGDAHSVPNSTEIQTLAEKCVQEEFNAYFDGCAQKCVRDKFILPLSHYENLESVVYGQIFPILVLLAVLANAAVALVLSKKHMITPTNVVLKYMAIAELLVGLVPLPWTLFFFTMGNFKKTYRLELWWCYLQKYSMDAFPPVFHNIAMWLTVLLAAQRYISISYPVHSRTACNVRNVRIATSIITFVSILCGLPKSFDYEYDTVYGWVFNQNSWTYTSSCVMVQTLLLSKLGQTVFFNIYFWTRAVGFIILPSILLVVLNGLLIKGIRNAQRRKLRLLREKRSEEAARQRDSNATSLMLVAIVSIFLVSVVLLELPKKQVVSCKIVNLPQALFMGLLCVCETFSIRLLILEGTFPAVFLIASNMIVIATYPINFGIYCFMSSSFRQTFKVMFLPGSTRLQCERKNDASVVHSGRRSELCSHLVNICTESDVLTQPSSQCLQVNNYSKRNIPH